MRLSYNFDTRIFENLAYKPARQASGVFAVGRDSSEEFGHDLFGRDEEGARTIGVARSLSPRVTGKEDGKPKNGVGEDLSHRFGVP